MEIYIDLQTHEICHFKNFNIEFGWSRLRLKSYSTLSTILIHSFQEYQASYVNLPKLLKVTLLIKCSQLRRQTSTKS